MFGSQMDLSHSGTDVEGGRASDITAVCIKMFNTKIIDLDNRNFSINTY